MVATDTQNMQEKFLKLGIKSFSELALILPYAYEDLRLSQNLDTSSLCIDATVQNVTKTKNSLQIEFFAHNLKTSLRGVVFNPKSYSSNQFIVGTRGYFYATPSYKNGFISLLMPKKVTLVGEIVPKYKSKLRSDILYKFIKENLNLKNLLDEGLDEDVAKELLAFHFVKDLPTKELSKKSLDVLKYTEIFIYLKELMKKKRSFKSSLESFRDYALFLKRLPFKLTNDQLNAIEDIKNDFKKALSARRVVVGDVGSGKTMVILACAFMLYPKKSILMVPTTILANQIYEESCKYLYDFKIALVTNKTKKGSLDEFDFIIGTHALLYRTLPQAPLIMVDEQHRFGTQQRNMLSKLVEANDKKAHFLQFSATPIPRTQAMIESMHVDVSLIKETPFKKDITTLIIHKTDFKKLLEHIQIQLAQNNQVLIIYPLVEQSDVLAYQSIEEARGFWEKNFKNVYVTHGSDRQKEQVLLDFRDRGDILIATTVVEVGISLPRLSTIIIVGAERLGLASLHQLRGRVSRNGLKGYCFLYTNQQESSRLERFCTTTNGFDIAELDLEFRKSGDLLRGESQSGKAFRWIDLSSDADIIKKAREKLLLSH